MSPLPPIALGTFSIPEPLLPDLISQALSLGYTMFDTAYRYPNQRALGEALKASGVARTTYLVQSKASINLLAGHRRLYYLDSKHARSAYRKMASGLGMDRVDIYQLHCPFGGYHRHARQLSRMKQRGEIAYWGICNISQCQLEDLYRRSGCYPDIVQVEVHPYYTNKELLQFCVQHGIRVQARSPFAHGDAMEEWLQEPILIELSHKYSKTIPQIILRWLTQQGVMPLPRTSSLQHLADNIHIFDFQLLPSELQSIDSLNRNHSFGVKSTRIN